MFNIKCKNRYKIAKFGSGANGAEQFNMKPARIYINCSAHLETLIKSYGHSFVLIMVLSRDKG